MKNPNSRNRWSRRGVVINIPGVKLSQRRLHKLRFRVRQGAAYMCVHASSGWVIQVLHPDFKTEHLYDRVHNPVDYAVSCFAPIMLRLIDSKRVAHRLSNLEYYGFAIEPQCSYLVQHYQALDHFWREEATALKYDGYPQVIRTANRQSKRPALRILIPGATLPQQRLQELRKRVMRGAAWLQKRFDESWITEALAKDFQFSLMKLRSGIGPTIFRWSYWQLEKSGTASSDIPNQVWYGFQVEPSAKDQKAEYMALDYLWTAEAKRALEKLQK